MYMLRFTEGSTLSFRSVTKEDSGAFLCIAANGIPPKRSKRFALKVLCKYHFSAGAPTHMGTWGNVLAMF